MTKLLENKLALITGGNKGVGQAIAERYASEGARLILTARNEADLEEVAKLCREKGAPDVQTVKLDLSDGAAVTKLGQDLASKGINVLVNNAGVWSSESPEEGDADQWENMVDLNLIAPMRLTRALLPPMVKAGGGTIVNISSVAVAGNCLTYDEEDVDSFPSPVQAMLDKNVKVMAVYPEMVGSQMATGRGDKSKMIQPEDLARVAMLPFELSTYAVPVEITVKNGVSMETLTKDS